MPQSSPIPSSPLKDQPVHRFLLEKIQKWDPQSTAFINSSTGKKLSYGAFYEFTVSLANGLRNVGLRKGDVVVLCMPNRPEYAVIAVSVLQCGGVICGMDHAMSEAEISTRLQHSECRFVFTTSQLLSKIQQAANTSSFVQKIFIADLPPTSKNGSNPSSKIQNLNALFYSPEKEEIDEVGMWTKIDLALLAYTKSVDGNVKGVMLNHYNVVTALQLMSQNFFVQPVHGDHLIGVHPFFDLQGFMIMLQSMFLGCTLVTMEEFHAEEYYGLIQQYKVPLLHVTPSILINLAKDPLLPKYDISSVTACLARTDQVGKAAMEKLVERHKHIKHIVQAYGPPVTCMISHCTMDGQEKNRGCGILLSEMECKVIDSTGKELDEDKKGELCIRGPTSMAGYWKDPDATASVISTDGWLHTGDIVYYDDEECYYLIGNKKGLLTSNGKMISLVDLECTLRLHPQIMDAAVTTTFHIEHGQVPTAFIVRANGNSQLSTPDVHMYLTETEDDGSLKLEVKFVKEIPRLSTGEAIMDDLRYHNYPNAKL